MRQTAFRVTFCISVMYSFLKFLYSCSVFRVTFSISVVYSFYTLMLGLCILICNPISEYVFSLSEGCVLA